MAVEIPHLAFPFRYEPDGSPAQVEQDSPEEILACVAMALATEPGARPDLPDYGVPDLAFDQLPLDLAEVVSRIERYEPRVRLLLEAHQDALEETVVRVLATARLEDDE